MKTIHDICVLCSLVAKQFGHHNPHPPLLPLVLRCLLASVKVKNKHLQ